MADIFISYRREDSADATGRIYDQLEARFGSSSVLIDVDAIPLGVDFRDYLAKAIDQCKLLLVVIGDRWLDVRSENGKRRLDDPADFVRIEIEAALARDLKVIPVLVGGANMPKESDLPESIKPLAFRNAAEVRAGRHFRDQMGRLIRALGQVTLTEEDDEFDISPIMLPEEGSPVLMTEEQTGDHSSPIWWHVAHDGVEPEGPVSFADLKSMARDGRIQPDTYVWVEGLSDWIEARQVSEIFESDG